MSSSSTSSTNAIDSFHTQGQHLVRRIKIKFNIASRFLNKIYVSEHIGIEPFFISENAAETTAPDPLLLLR